MILPIFATTTTVICVILLWGRILSYYPLIEQRLIMIGSAIFPITMSAIAYVLGLGYIWDIISMVGAFALGIATELALSLVENRAFIWRNMIPYIIGAFILAPFSLMAMALVVKVFI